MRLNTLIVDYLNALRVEQGATAATHKSYQAQLRHFHNWLIENGYPEPTVSDFTTPVCRHFLYALADSRLDTILQLRAYLGSQSAQTMQA